VQLHNGPMAPDPFNGLTEFLAVADARSFTAAAASLGVTPTAVINFFDTADAYASGQSETILGQVLMARRSEVVIATKVG
ncbi:aldo/keto reductase, partial [Rhizobium ruizarguesonis]